MYLIKIFSSMYTGGTVILAVKYNLEAATTNQGF